MRNYIFYSIVVVSFLFHACDGVSKDYNELNKDNLAGTYKITSFEVSGIETQTNNGSEEQTTFDIEGSNFEEVRIIFTESGRAITRGSHTLTIVSTKDGVTQTEVEQTMITIDDDYTLDGDQNRQNQSLIIFITVAIYHKALTAKMIRSASVLQANICRVILFRE